MRRSITFLVLLLVVVGLRAAQATTYEVKIGNNLSNSYSPFTLTIRAGDEVKFVWVSGDHPTVSDSQPAAWATFDLNSADNTRTVPFPKVGSFPYHCSVHAVGLGNGTYIGMTGTITVQAGLATTAAQPGGPALSLFPNPAHGQTTVQVGASTGPDYQLRLSNVLGGEVRRLTLRPTDQLADGVQLDLNNLPPGLYFCSLLLNDKTLLTKRLTVL